jgi:UDP-glucose 4-epimerase
MDAKTVAVTGVAGYWGSRVARRLLDEPGYRVLGLDTHQPAATIDGLDFILADLRNPALSDLFRAERVSAVCHLKLREVVEADDATYDSNVGGTEKLLHAAAAGGVERLVLKSSATVYGANPSNSAFLDESHLLRGGRRYAYNRHLVEMENALAAFGRNHDTPALTVLRFANIVGPTADAPLARYLRQQWAVRPLGYDPQLQVIHEDDVIEALAHVLINGGDGVFNVAAEGLLPLNRLYALTRTLPLPVLTRLADWGLSRADELRAYLPLELDYLRYRWVADLTRMREELGFAPRLTAEEAVKTMSQRFEAAEVDGAGLSPERLLNAIEARRRRHAAAAWSQEENRDE